jgi:hypothetical protein
MVEVIDALEIQMQSAVTAVAPNPTAAATLREETMARVATIVFFLGLVPVLVWPLFSHAPWMIFVQDDFLYYLKVAQNIAHGHGSTFNSITSTNGYQPLWLAVLVALSWFTEDPKAILTFLAATDFLAALATFLLARKLIRSSCARPLLVFALAAFITIYSVTLFFYGMEATLAVPILLAVCCLLLNVSWLAQSPLHTFALGLMLSAMVLARIDTLILGALILAGMLVSTPLRALMRPRLITGVVLGLVPLACYFLLNHFLFHTWLPISGSAKELRLTHLPSLEPWRVFFHPLAAAYAVVLLAALLLIPGIRSRLTPMSRVLFPAVLFFPFLYYFILCCVSDWTLWGWYMYPLRSALCVSFLIFCLWRPARQFLERPLVTGVLLLVVFASLGMLRWRRQQADIYAATLDIQSFASTHPGIYAMGDRAGRVGYLLPYPLVQTEGLMMDRAYLNLIKNQTPLKDMLARYDVRYYVATAYAPFTGCFQAAEPAKGGPTSAKMRAAFCEAPAATYFHDGIETLIFDMDKVQ